MHMPLPTIRRRKQRLVTGTLEVRARVQALGCKAIYHRQLSPASEPLRSSGASTGTPKRSRQQGKRPPSPIDELRPLEPPQQLVSVSCDGVEGGGIITSSPARA